MKKTNYTWSIRTLLQNFEKIEFPEFQREPTIWELDRKRRLIDSIIRDIDIASIYFHKNADDIFECIDGRQRINAIYSYIGLNSEFSDDKYTNNFTYKSSHELRHSQVLGEYHDKTYEELNDTEKQRILDYQFNIIEVSLTSENEKEDELNLMFLRLQLGAPLNAGEKLHAMVGDMRNYIFKGDTSLGKKMFFEYLQIPERRFSRELTAAQIALNFFSLKISKDFRRARFLDLQEFFKTNIEFKSTQKMLAKELEDRLDVIYHRLKDSDIDLRNRAIGITTFFFINKLIENGDEHLISKFINFLRLFIPKLREQVKKGIDIDRNYQELLKFQNYISQAAVEKYAIENRQKFLQEYFNYYLEHNSTIKTTPNAEV